MSEQSAETEAKLLKQKLVENMFMSYYSNAVILDLNGNNDFTSQSLKIDKGVYFQYRVITTKHSDIENMVVLAQFCNLNFDLRYEIKLISWDLSLETSFLIDDSWRVIYDADLKQQKPYRYHAIFYRISLAPDPKSFIGSLYDDTELTDFELKGEEGSVRVHRAVLAACSTKLREKLLGPWRGKSVGVLNAAVQLTTLQHFKDFLYLRKIPDTGLGALLLLARYYNVADLELLIQDKIAGGAVTKDEIECLEMFRYDLFELQENVRSQLGKSRVTPFWKLNNSIKAPKKLPTLKFSKHIIEIG